MYFKCSEYPSENILEEQLFIGEYLKRSKYPSENILEEQLLNSMCYVMGPSLLMQAQIDQSRVLRWAKISSHVKSL